MSSDDSNIQIFMMCLSLNTPSSQLVRDNYSNDAFLNSSDHMTDDNHLDITNTSTYSSNNSEASYNEIKKEIIYVAQRIVIPVICIVGVIGNTLNLLIFIRRLWQNHIHSIERGAIMELTALAFSDLIFCFITCVGSLVPSHMILFLHKDFRYYNQLYGGVLQNIFIKTSTWLTTIAAVSRYAAVCYPLFARQFIRLSHIKFAIVCSFIFSFVVHIPLLWMHEVHHLDCGNITISILDTGVFVKNITFNKTFTYLWAILGYLIPAGIMGYCNASLIVSFRHSMKLRSHMRRAQSHASETNDRITVTLIVVVLMFIILISPSEMLHFYSIIYNPTDHETYAVAMVS